MQYLIQNSVFYCTLNLTVVAVRLSARCGCQLGQLVVEQVATVYHMHSLLQNVKVPIGVCIS